MGRKPFKSAEEKLQVVLGVLKGEMTQVEAARRLEMSQTTIAKWQKQFLEGAHEALARGENAKAPASRRETDLQPQDDGAQGDAQELVIRGSGLQVAEGQEVR